MKAKIKRGGSFRGALNYIFDVGATNSLAKNIEYIGGNMSGETAMNLSVEFSVVCQLRPDITKPVWHCSLTLPAGERLTSEQWRDLTTDFLIQMKFNLDTTPYVVVRHQDTAHDHVHLVVSRIGLDGQVWLGQWEARRAIEVTQTLERDHGLIMTEGLSDTRAARKTLSANELNQAVRTGKEPVRQRLQRLVDEAIKDNPSALSFAERLELAGVGVKANLASTGRLNGFSFELDGIAFKGQGLGHAYKWSSLQQRGVMYEQTRDGEGLQRFCTAIANRGEYYPITETSQHDAARVADTADLHCSRDDRDADLVTSFATGHGCDSSSLRADHGHPTSDMGRDVRLYDQQCDNDASGESRPIQRNDRSVSTDDSNIRNQPREIRYQRSAIESSGNQAVSSQREASLWRDESKTPMVETGVELESCRDAGSTVSRNWAKRFTLAITADSSTARTRVDESSVVTCATERTSVTNNHRQSSQQIDPSSYLQTQGFVVERDRGCGYSAVTLHGDEVYRLTRTPNGDCLAYDSYGNQVGDTIALLQTINPHLGYAEAVYCLLSSTQGLKHSDKTTPVRQCPVIPLQFSHHRDHGRQYVHMKGISRVTIEHAEKMGMMRYSDGSILFVGYDPQRCVQLITVQAINGHDSRQRWDMMGSDKRFPPILPGDPAKIWVVDDGMNALALHDMAKREGKKAPTVIVSGGSQVYGFLDSFEIKNHLKQAMQVIVSLHPQSSTETPEKINSRYQKQLKSITDIIGREVHSFRLKQGNDLVTMNLAQMADLKRVSSLTRQRERER